MLLLVLPLHAEHESLVQFLPLFLSPSEGTKRCAELASVHLERWLRHRRLDRARYLRDDARLKELDRLKEESEKAQAERAAMLDELQMLK